METQWIQFVIVVLKNCTLKIFEAGHIIAESNGGETNLFVVLAINRAVP